MWVRWAFPILENACVFLHIQTTQGLGIVFWLSGLRPLLPPREMAQEYYRPKILFPNIGLPRTRRYCPEYYKQTSQETSQKAPKLLLWIF